MYASFPVTGPIGNDANIVIQALNARSAQLKSLNENIFRKITMTALKAIGLTAIITALASIPISLSISALATGLSISCLVLYLLLDPKSTRELIIREQWKSLFQSLRKGNGKEILETYQELAKQKEKRLPIFTQTLGSLNSNDTLPFFHKTCLVGYLQIALEKLKNYEDQQALSHAHMALSHFGESGFPFEIKKFLEEITESPADIRQFIKAQQSGNDLHALDDLIAKFKGVYV